MNYELRVMNESFGKLYCIKRLAFSVFTFYFLLFTFPTAYFVHACTAFIARCH